MAMSRNLHDRVIEFQGQIVRLSVQTKNVRIAPEPNPGAENAPSHRVFVGRAHYAE